MLRHLDEVIALYGRVDVLINNAAASVHGRRIEELTPEDIRKTVDTNLLSHFWVSVIRGVARESFTRARE